MAKESQYFSAMNVDPRAPVINGMECLDTGGQVVGEDIMWLDVNGAQRMFVTFMGGTGLDQPDGGSVGVSVEVSLVVACAEFAVWSETAGACTADV